MLSGVFRFNAGNAFAASVPAAKIWVGEYSDKTHNRSMAVGFVATSGAST
jgi:hypothetical protein